METSIRSVGLLITMVFLTMACKKAPNDGSASPTPAASATATPTSSPSRTDVSAACLRHGEGSASLSSCGAGRGTFVSLLDETYAYMANTQPYSANFRINGIPRDGDLFRSQLIEILSTRSNTCAIWMSHEERLWIRDNRNLNETYAIHDRDGFLMSQVKQTCEPATKFPPIYVDPMVDTSCGLPPVKVDYIETVRDDDQGFVTDIQQVYNLIVQRHREGAIQPPFLKLSSLQPANDDSYEIINLQNYLDYYQLRLRERGYCIVYDGGGFKMKKPMSDKSRWPDNSFSEFLQPFLQKAKVGTTGLWSIPRYVFTNRPPEF